VKPTARVLATLVLVASAVLALGARDADAQRLRSNNVRISPADRTRLDRTAQRFDGEIRRKFTPHVDLHIAEATLDKGVVFRKTSNPRRGTKGPTVFQIYGLDQAGGELQLVLSGGVSGHVMQPTWGGRPFSVVEAYGMNDTIHLTHLAPGASQSARLLAVKSRGLVTQEGFTVKLGQGQHSFFYFRGGPNEASGGEGSEPELRRVDMIVH
jgi:hypothetical protein